jgi:tetratricopeptide (TPR) repeat protein
VSKTLLSISLVALGAVTFLALRAPAAPPPNLDRALTAQSELAAQHPNDPKILNDLGNLQMLAGHLDDAETSYRQALQIAPDLTSARYNLALLLEQRKKYKEAREQLGKVLEAEPGNAWAHYQLGVVYAAQDSERQAIAQYAKAFRLDPQLAFPEVNPHVIDNPYVTKAMLRAYRDLPLASRAPKSYEEPSHIVAMMLPESPDQGGAAAAPAPAEGAEKATSEAASKPGMSPKPAFAPEGQGEGAVSPDEAEKVLRQEDLQGQGELNQAPAPSGTYIPPQGGTRVRTYPPGYLQPGQTPSSGQRGGAATPEGRATPSRPGTSRPNGPVHYVPGVPSTARLDTELLPGPPPAAPPTPAG